MTAEPLGLPPGQPFHAEITPYRTHYEIRLTNGVWDYVEPWLAWTRRGAERKARRLVARKNEPAPPTWIVR